MLLRELHHDNIVHLDSVHINRAEPSLWLAFDYADHDLFELVRFHREHRDSRRTNPTGEPSGRHGRRTVIINSYRNGTIIILWRGRLTIIILGRAIIILAPSSYWDHHHTGTIIILWHVKSHVMGPREDPH